MVKLWQSVVRWWRGEPNKEANLAELAQAKAAIGIGNQVNTLEFPASEPKPSRRNPAKVRAAMRRLERDFNPEPGIDRDV